VEARVTHLFIKPAHGSGMEPRSTVRAVEDKGLADDAAFGTSRRQVLVIDDESLTGFGLEPGVVRENITVSGLQLHGLPRGTRLHIEDVVLEVTGDCTPCDFLDTLRPGLKAAILGRRGLLARVMQSGELKVGAPVRVQSAESIGAPVTS
jgi:MOSC domain-containing protein YiiM